MIEYVTDRYKITQKILEIIHPEYGPADLKRASVSWWVNIRTGGGLGLTDVGFKAFQLADLESYTYEVDIQKQTIYVIGMRVDRVLSSPYYLRYIKRDRYITVYDTRIAMMIKLYGTFSSYIESLESKND